MSRPAAICAMIVLALAALDCGASRQSGLCADDFYTQGSAQGDVEALLAEADGHWAKRSDIGELRQALVLWEKVTTIDPTRYDIFVKLSRGYYFLADGHLSFDEEKKDEMLKGYERGTYFAEVALRGLNPEFRRRVCANEPFEKAIKAVDKGSVPAVYWYSTNLGKWGLASSIIKVLENKDKIAAMIETARKLDPTYFYGAPDRYFGAYYTKIPFPNGDLARSQRHFARSLKVEPSYFATRVLMASMLATKKKDRKMFEDALSFVINAPTDVIPEIQPEQEIEQRKAKALMDDIDDYFE